MWRIFSDWLHILRRETHESEVPQQSASELSEHQSSDVREGILGQPKPQGKPASWRKKFTAKTPTRGAHKWKSTPRNGGPS